MPTSTEYEKRIQELDWDALRNLWRGVQQRDTLGWNPGQAFQYLILRAFQLDGAEVTWPYRVELFGEEAEEIDGAVHIARVSALIESKDFGDGNNVTIGPIAKLRNQLLRRPSGTVGVVFSRTGFTDPARILTHFALPQAIMLWSGPEIEYAIAQESMCELLELKFRICVEHGLPDYDVRERDIP